MIAAPLVAYIVATRRLSGKISTSEATDLWKESSDIRKDYRERLGLADADLVGLRSRMHSLEQENDTLKRENRELRGKIDRLEGVVNGG